MTPPLIQHRPLLLGIAYRMLGSYAEAEDVCQDAYFSFERANEEIREPRAYLITIVTRLCMDRLKSARVRREDYVGEWLPEPVYADTLADPAIRAEYSETVSTAFLLLLERLSPIERASLILRDIFDFDYSEISGFVSSSSENCRKIVSRARETLRKGEKKVFVSGKRKKELLDAFMKACSAGSISRLMELLSEDIRVYTDSGGKVKAAARNIIVGPDHCARFFLGILKKYPDSMVAVEREINGSPGLVLYDRNKVYSAVSFEFSENNVERIYSTLNPEKLTLIARAKKPGIIYRTLYRWFSRRLEKQVS